MPSTDDANPFEAPASDDPGVHPPGPRGRPWPLILFLVRRTLLVVVIPLLLGVLALLWRAGPFWVAVFATWALFVPTTAAILADRFLAPVTDDTPVVLADGLRMDRARFRRLLRVSAVERLALSSMLVALAVGLAPTRAGLLAVFLVLIAAWATWATIQRVRLGDALVAQIEEDPHEVLRKLTPIARWPRLNRPLIEVALLGIANAEVLLGAPDDAISTLERIRPNGLVLAHFARAALLAGRGRTEDARHTLEGREPTRYGERLTRTRAEALIALEEGRWDDVIRLAREAQPLLGDAPEHARTTLQLAHVAALRHLGRHRRAEALLERHRSGVREWMLVAWPGLRAGLEATGEGPAVS